MTLGLELTQQVVRNLIETSALGVVAADLTGRITVWGRGSERIYGWTEAEALGRFLPMIPPEKLEEFKRLRDMIVRGRTLNGVTLHRRRKDGATLTLNATILPIRDALGAVCGTFAIVSDMSDVEAAEQEFRRTEELFGIILENSSDMVSLIDRDGVVLYVNPAVRRILGLEPHELVGKRSVDIVHEEDREELLAAHADRLRGGTGAAEVRVRHKDGSWRSLETTGRLVNEGKGRVSMVSSCRDVTDRRRREATHRAVKTKDVSNLLTSILGYAELIRNDSSEHDPRREWAEQILESAHLASGLERLPVEPPPVPARSARILIVDDEPAMCTLTATILGREGFSVQTASSGPEALACLRTAPVDLLLTDVHMPEMGGVELARKACEALPGLRVIFMTANPGDAALPPTGVVIAKPFTVRNLVLRVRAAAGAPRS